MLLSSLLPLAVAYWPVILVALAAVHLLRNKFNNGLNRFPGPAVAGWTNWWRFFELVNKRRTERTHIELHEKYGDVVRLGPNVLSFADPKALKVIYGLNKGFTKSEFYPIQQATSKGKRLQSLFSTRNEDYHSKYRRCVNSAFAMSSLVSYEPLVDSTTAVYIKRTRELFVEKDTRCNFSQWLQYFAFDVIGELTWSKRLGYIERNEDVDGVVSFLGDFLSYCAAVGQMPFLDTLWKKNPLKLKWESLGLTNTIFPVTKFALDRAAERAGEKKMLKQSGGAIRDQPGQGIDLLTKFQQAQLDHPEFMTDQQVLASCTSMIFAGSETTAISLSAVFYYLLRHPRVYAKLMLELDENAANGSIAERPNNQVSWAEAQKLPYLDAVIQESFRLHPAAGLLLERYTPPQGVEICGQFIPGGVIVGCNAWVVHRRKEVFGDDTESFRPERWIEAEPARLKEMKAAMFQFGAGSRTCLGKNISLLEMYKLVPTFLRNFEIQMDCPDWKTRNGWFVRQEEFWTRFSLRSVPPSA